MSTGDAGTKRMKTTRPGTTFRDVTGHWPEPVTTDDERRGRVPMPGGEASASGACADT